VLIPGDLPADRDHDLRVRARERDDADRRPAEAAREALDRPPVRTEVEQRRRLDNRLLTLRELSQDRLGHRLDRRRAAAEQLAEEAALLAFAGLHGKAWSALADPAVGKG